MDNLKKGDRIISTRKILGIIIGASEWPKHEGLISSQSMANSAKGIKKYLTSSLLISENNMLDLFNCEYNAIKIIRHIKKFLNNRQENAKCNHFTDVILYFVGHGISSTEYSEFSLAIKDTEKETEYITAISAQNLATCLNKSARKLRRFVILDCCWASQANKHFMNDRNTLTSMVTEWMNEFPKSGTALLCASDCKTPASMGTKGSKCTLFTGTLLKVLTTGAYYFPEFITLNDIFELTLNEINKLPLENQVIPQIHNPKQPFGVVSTSIGLFPNPAYNEKLQKIPNDIIFEGFAKSKFNLIWEKGYSIHCEDLADLNKLPESTRLKTLKFIFDYVSNESYFNRGAALFIELLIHSVLKMLKIEEKSKICFLAHLWQNPNVPTYLFFHFLIKNIISISDIRAIAQLLESKGDKSSIFILPYEIWESGIFGVNSEVNQHQITKIFDSLAEILKNNIKICAKASNPDGEYENLCLKRELDELNEGYDGINLWPLDEAREKTGPFVLKAFEELIDYSFKVTDLGKKIKEMDLKERYQWVGKVAVAFAKGKHWGCAFESIKLLYRSNFWLRNFENPSLFSKEYLEINKLKYYAYRKGREVIRIMKDNCAPIRWEILIIILHQYISFYKFDIFCPKPDYGFQDLTKSKLQDLSLKLLYDPNREDDIFSLALDIRIIDYLRLFAWYNGHMLKFSYKDTLYLVQERNKCLDILMDNGNYYNTRLRTYLYLFEDALMISNSISLNMWVLRVLEAAKIEISWLRSKEKVIWAGSQWFLFKELEECFNAITKAKSEGLIELNKEANNLYNYVTKAIITLKKACK